MAGSRFNKMEATEKATVGIPSNAMIPMKTELSQSNIRKKSPEQQNRSTFVVKLVWTPSPSIR
jgi:hypothetical protein